MADCIATDSTVRARPVADEGHGVHDHAYRRRAHAPARGRDRGADPGTGIAASPTMPVGVRDHSAPLPPRAGLRGAERQCAVTAPIALVLPGYERFAPRVGGMIERVAVGRFPNGELHAEVPARVDGRRCILVGSISPPVGNLERVTLIAHALRRAGAQDVTALLHPAYARQDHTRPTESVRLSWVGGLLRRKRGRLGSLRGRPQRGRGRRAGAGAHVPVAGRLAGRRAPELLARGGHVRRAGRECHRSVLGRRAGRRCGSSDRMGAQTQNAYRGRASRHCRLAGPTRRSRR
jgi:N-terminal domain of ribose phosphate pyrophosphokinase